MEILVNAFIKAAGWSILHALWQGAVIYIILLTILMFGSGMKAKTRYTFSYLALSIMLCWFLQTFFSEFMFRIQQQRNADLDMAIAAFSNSPLEILTLSSSLLEKAERNFPMIVFLYAAGLMVQSAFLLFGYHRIRQLKSTGLSELPSALQNNFTVLMTKLGLKRPVRFRLSSKVNVPLIIGYFKPLVLLPLSVLSHLDQKQLEAVIIHELAHIRRNDYLLNLLKITIETILFFNPFVWLCSNVVETEREYACDDLVLQLTGEPLIYAHTLMKLEHLKLEHNLFTLAITGKKFHLLNRIRRMTGLKTNTLNFKTQFLTILFISSVLLSVAWVPVKKDPEVIRQSDPEAGSATEPLLISFKQAPENPEIGTIRIGHTILQNDTTKRTFKIVFEDEQGQQKIFNSLEEMPAGLRADFLNGNRSGKYSAPVYHFGNGLNKFVSKFNKDTTASGKRIFKGNPSFYFKKDSIRFFRTDSSFWFNSTKLDADSIYRTMALSEIVITAPFGPAIGLKRDSEALLNPNKELLKKQGERLLKEKQTLEKQNELPPKVSLRLNYINDRFIEQRNEIVKKILESSQSRMKLEALLKKSSYRMNSEGELEEDINTVYNFDEGLVRKSDILRFIIPGKENQYGIYIPTKQERLNKLISNPANQDKLYEIVHSQTSASTAVLNTIPIYAFDEGVFKKSDIVEYLTRIKKPK